ncbi:MAG: hypothetical protein ABUL77_04985, partial [Bacteroidota bacterium]
MIKNFEETKLQLAELATVLNSFKSEAVQLRIIELVFQGGAERGAAPADEDSREAKSPARTRKRKAKAPTAAPDDGGQGSKGRRRGGGSGPV